MLAATLTGTPPDPLTSAIERYRAVNSYSVTIHSIHAGDGEHIRYFYQKPGFVRMEFIRPHSGAVLIYNPHTRNVRLWPFGVKHFPEIDLSPDNPLIRTARGLRVDRSDIGTLLENVRALRDGGKLELSGSNAIDGRVVIHFVVTGAGNFVIDGVHRYELWLDSESQFPLRVISRDPHDAIIETVTMEAPEINTALPESLFNP